MEFVGGVLPSVNNFSMVRYFVNNDIIMGFPLYKSFFTKKPSSIELENLSRLRESSIGLDVSEFMYLNKWFQLASSLPLRLRDLDKLMDMIALTYGQVMIIMSDLHESFTVPLREYEGIWEDFYHLQNFMEGNSLNSNLTEVMLSLEHMLLEDMYYPPRKTDLIRVCQSTAVHHKMYNLGCPKISYQSGLFSRYFYLLDEKVCNKERNSEIKIERDEKAQSNATLN